MEGEGRKTSNLFGSMTYAGFLKVILEQAI
jgi:hypothetical protein